MANDTFVNRKHVLLIFILACLVAAAALTLVCFADGPAEIKNIQLKESGMLTWDKYEGSDNIWLGYDIYSVPFRNGGNISECDISEGEHTISVNVYTEDGNVLLAYGEIFVKREGDNYIVIDALSETEEPAVTEPPTKAPEDEIDYGDGIIKNVKIEKDGTLTWDPYEKANKYWLGVAGNYLPAEIGAALGERITEPGQYLIEIIAYDNDKNIAVWSDRVAYDGSEFRFGSYAQETEKTETGPVDTADPVAIGSEPEGSQAGTEAGTEEKTANDKDKAFWLIPVICVAVAAAVVVIVVVCRKKSEGTKN